METDPLRGRNVVITGASGGIGAEIARLCAARGANLVLLARNIGKLEHLQKELEQNHRVNVTIYSLDVSDTDQVKEVFERIFDEVGDVDVLVNNAGFGIFRGAHEATIEEMKGMFRVNVVGLMACTAMCLPKMRARRFGHIINIASQAGKIATPKSGVYSASKSAVLSYTNVLRMELADFHVYVTSVNPGPVATNFFTIADEKGTYVKNVQRFMLKPEYVARKVVDSMLTKKREINLPRWMNMGSAIYVLFPRTFELIARRFLNKK